MITGELRGQIDRIWDAFWAGGIANPIQVVEQLTYLLFLKMAEEQHQLGLDRIVPSGYDWPSLLGLKGEAHYSAVGTYQCRPWRFGSVDYLNALAVLAPVVAELPVLHGAQVTSCWDAQLTTEMAGAGRALHEELLLNDLIADLC